MEVQNHHNIIIQKQRVLFEAKKQLKVEFIGIDNIIDQVVDLCSTWFLLPELQGKPVIINLWGLTGVGKSSLVNRLIELLTFNEKYYHFNLNEDNNYLSIRDRISEIFENKNGYPIILAFDEFQYARSLDKMRNEIVNSNHKIIWQILDSGKFTLSRDNYRIEDIYKLVLKLEYALSKHIKVINGKVKNRKKYFKNLIEDKEYEINDEKLKPKEIVYFIPQEYHMNIYNIAKEKFKSPLDVNQQLSLLNGSQTIKFLNDILSFSISPKTYDCTKSVIFILGNLDDAYTMSNSYNPDMDADEFHQQSLKINISNIKQALRLRFRNEQIARLGNNHIIYPAFSKETFEKIIKLDLEKISNKFKREYQIILKFDESLLNLIYDEGVYPSQGTRPVFSTIYQMVGSKIGKMISQLYLKNIHADFILMKFENDEIRINYFNANKEVFSFSETPTLNLSKLRKNKKDDVQALVAVHETGHALISIFLLNTIPEVIYSRTADAYSDGFVYTNFKWKYISKKEILSRTAFYLGGIIAEKLIFGEEYITNGSEGDIEKATTFITGMLKESGMGNLPASYQVADSTTNNKLFDFENQINQKVKELIKQGEQLTLKTLRKHQQLLILIADYLSDHTVLHKEHILSYLVKYAKDFDTNNIIENGDHLFYRKRLKQKVNESKLEENILSTNIGFSLNKEEKSH